jgi:hypothetical protein
MFEEGKTAHKEVFDCKPSLILGGVLSFDKMWHKEFM